jgi:hypothetical protein
MITPQVDAQYLRQALKELKDLEENSIKDLRQDLRTKISPLAKQVSASIPVEPPLSGFGNNGATGWSRVRPSVSFTPGRSRKTGYHLISIRVNPQGKKRGVYIAELAGSRSGGKTAQGRAMIRNLNADSQMKGKGGRFAYKKFRLLRPDAVQIATRILQQTVKKVNKKLEI